MSSALRHALPLSVILDLLNTAYPYHAIRDLSEMDPFKLLVCSALSGVAKQQQVGMIICARLFLAADTPEAILKLPTAKLDEILSPLPEWENKRTALLELCRTLISEYGNAVPESLEALCQLPGISQTVAKRVLALGFNHPTLCVDDNVHRIMNRMGFVETRNAAQTAKELEKELPQTYWSLLGWVLDRHAHAACLPNHPKCDICPVTAFCPKLNL